jgi:hypothetical protein
MAPRAVLVHRSTEYEELIARHGTRGQAAFYLSSRGRDIGEVQHRHELQVAAVQAVTSAVPVDWRQGRLERRDLSRFQFAPEDVILVVGQDGLVANVAKYLAGQPVVGINPDPMRNPGVLVPHAPDDTAQLLHGLSHSVPLTMVEALADDGQRLVALNEVFLGPPSHQTARYTVTTPDGTTERQASSGLVVSSGTGATGWCRSLWLERHSRLALPDPTSTALAWFVREAWPSPATGTTVTEGLLADTELKVLIESDHLVAFGDGIEDDALSLSWGQTVTLRAAGPRLMLVT